MPVVRSAWVEDCRRTGSRLPYAAYTLAPLTDCLISFTNVSKRDRPRLCKAVEELGGRVTPDMTKTCTHLVVGHFSASPKLKCASPRHLASKWQSIVFQCAFAIACQVAHARCWAWPWSFGCWCVRSQQHVVDTSGANHSCCTGPPRAGTFRCCPWRGCKTPSKPSASYPSDPSPCRASGLSRAAAPRAVLPRAPRRAAQRRQHRCVLQWKSWRTCLLPLRAGGSFGTKAQY